MVDFEVGATLVLRSSTDDKGALKIAAVSLVDRLKKSHGNSLEPKSTETLVVIFYHTENSIKK